MKILTYALTPFLLAMAMVAIVLSPIACNHGGAASCQPQTVGCVIIGSLVDCSGVNSVPSAVTVATPIVTGLINGAKQPDGSINWTSIEAQLEQAAWQFGICVIADIWNTLMSGPSGSGAQATATTLKLDPHDLKTEFDRIRAHVAPGYAVKLQNGGTL